MSETPTISHVIFDFDGIILDTERVYSEANDRTLKLYGKSFNNELKSGMMGRVKEEAVRWLLHALDLRDIVSEHEYMQHYDKNLDEMMQKAEVMPGIRRLIEHLHATGVPLAICTSSSNEEFSAKRHNCEDLLPKFHHLVISGSDPDVTKGKPASDPYLVTMKRFTNPPISPKSVLVFEDSVSGVKSALDAGCTVVMVPQKEFLPKNWSEIEAELRPKVAEIVYSMEYFFPEKYGLQKMTDLVN